MWWNKYTLYQKVNYYILVILGFIFILFFIYYIFIRKRLPRDIPFMLTEYYFFILLYLCLGYIFIIYRIIYPSKTNQLLSNIISYIGTPFSTFDSFLKQNKYISHHPGYGRSHSFARTRALRLLQETWNQNTPSEAMRQV